MAALLLLAGCRAQTLDKQALNGTWHLTKIIDNGQLLFDRHDTSISIMNVFDLVAETQGAISGEDSIRIQKKGKELFEMSSRLSYRFTADSVFLSNMSLDPAARGVYTISTDKTELILDFRGDPSGYYTEQVSMRFEHGKLIIRQEFKKGAKVLIQEFEQFTNAAR